MERKEISKEELVRNLKHNGLSIDELAYIYDCTAQHIRNEIVRNGFNGVKDLRKRG